MVSLRVDLADAITGAARHQGEATSRVRGADWQVAVVTAVDTTTGTVDCGTIRARRLDCYSQPAVGDRIVLTNSGSGNWVAVGRTSTDAGTWTTLTLASGFEWAGHGFTPSYLTEGPWVTWRGRIKASSGTIPNNTTIATIPSAVRPAGGNTLGWASPRNSNVFPAVVRVEITTSGVLRTYEIDNPPTWISLDGVRYPID